MNLLNETYFLDLAMAMASGDRSFTQDDMVSIASALDFSGMKSRYLPQKNLANAKLSIQKQACQDFVKKLWGLNQDKLIEMERSWLLEIRSETGVKKKNGKEDAEDLVSPQILARIVSVAYLHHLAEREGTPTDGLGTKILLDESLRSLNIFIANACLKGRMRSMRVAMKKGKPKIASVTMIKMGVPVGTPGLFLPNPSKSLVEIFSYLRREKIRPIVYK